MIYCGVLTLVLLPLYFPQQEYFPAQKVSFPRGFWDHVYLHERAYHRSYVARFLRCLTG